MAMTADPYASAKASLRDNVKTLIAMLGGAIAVLLAGTPFSGYAKIERFSGSWLVATIALLAALVFLAAAVRKLLSILRPDLTSIHVLCEQPNDSELQAVCKRFGQQKQSLLPKACPGQPAINDVTGLLEAESRALDDYLQKRDSAKDESDRLVVADYKESYDRIRENLEVINHWLSFVLLDERVTRGIDDIIWKGFFALLSIAVFVFFSSPSEKKEGSAASSIYFIVTPLSSVAAEPHEQPFPVLAPVLFATNEADLTKDAIARIDVARAFLRTHPGTGILIFANTDTMGGEKLNAELAARRADRVASLLRSEGGISASRIFVTPLAKKDLPRLTQQETESEANRAVEMVLILLPSRQ